MSDLSLLLQELETKTASDELRGHLVAAVNDLLLHDFNRLVALLYRIDIRESQLKQVLKDQPQTDAAVLITDLILKRQAEKKRSRDSFPPAAGIPDDEKW